MARMEPGPSGGGTTLRVLIVDDHALFRRGLQMVLSGIGLIAKDWAKEVGVNYAPPTFVGPEEVAPAATAETGMQAPPAASDKPTEIPEIKDPLADALAAIRNQGGAKPDAADIGEGKTVDPLAEVMADIKSKAHSSRNNATTIRPAAFSHKTSRKSRFAALPAPAVEAPAQFPLAAAVAAPADSRTSSSRQVFHPPSARSAHRDRHARSHSWVTISFAPRRAKRPAESKSQASSSASLARGTSVRTIEPDRPKEVHRC